jgi:[protein-PII] uridylyltransferase
LSSGPALHSDDSPLAATIAAVKAEMAAGRARIREMHDRGLDGLQVCGRLTSLVDAAIVKLFDAAEKSLGDSAPVNLRSRIALVGLGSYGRRQCAPYSDVDLMLLHDDMEPAELTAVVRRFTNSIYDAGMQLGHSVRTGAEAVQLAKADAVICSSLIDCRLIGGAQALFEDFRAQFEKMVRRRSKAVSKSFCEARDGERNQYGESLYLLEPHVKRSRGALRDVHLLRWLGFAEHGESNPDRLHLIGAISKFEHHRLMSAELFLLRLRNEMHFNAGVSKDSLDRAEQLRVAEVFGYRGDKALLPVERFMRDYFHHANHVWQMVSRREALLEGQSKVGRILDPVFRRSVEGDYRIGIRNISATRSGLAKLEGSLAEVLRLVELSAQKDRPLDSATFSALLLAAPEMSDEMTPEVAARFMQILGTPSSAGAVLRTLHELGYLEKVIPPLKHARCLLQFNQYHKFTVDEHSLVAIEKASEFGSRTDALGAAYRAIRNKGLLNLTLLLHDLGKGYEEDHSILGARIAIEMGERLLLPEKDIEDASYLVLKHLTMAHLAFRRDIEDRRVVAEFAKSIQTAERLKMLLVVTCADLAAVGPDVLTQWKIEVLADLYVRTLTMLGDPTATGFDANARRDEMLRQFSRVERADENLRRLAESLPASYLASHSAAESAETSRRLKGLPTNGGWVWGHALRETGTVEFVAGINQGHGRGLFAQMAGVLSSKGLEIISAYTQELAGGVLLLRYVATDPEFPQGPPAGRLEEVSSQMETAIAAGGPPQFRRVWGADQAAAAARLTAMPNEVRIDNSASDWATVIEVFTFDRSGLLYELASKLHGLELTIRHAKIATYIDQVVDVFYVTSREGEKILDPERIAAIREQLFSVISDNKA